MVTFALLEQVKGGPTGETLADDVVLTSVSGKLSGACARARQACIRTQALPSCTAAEQLLVALDSARRAADVIIAFTRANVPRDATAS